MAIAFQQLVLPLFEALGFGFTPSTAPSTSPTITNPSASPQTAPPPVKTRQVLASNQRLIEFSLKRGKRKSIGFLINDDGLTVSAPRWVTLTEVDQAVIEKSDWIERKIVEWREHQQRRMAAKITWQNGQTIQVLGQPVRLVVNAQQTGTNRVENLLHIGLPSDACEERIRNSVQAWLQTQARDVFAQRIDVICNLGAKRPTRWGLSSARTRWGSCNSDGTVRLNWRLIHFKLDVIDYVVAHELAHLSEMNHSKAFWQTVAGLFPEYEKARAELAHYTDDIALN
jgi:predicted metal-dependent hydrolase